MKYDVLSATQSPKDGKTRIDVGIEIGTSKVCVIVGERTSRGAIKILGIGQAPSRGVRKGVIVDFNLAAKSLRKAVTDAEDKSDVIINCARLAVSGHLISSFNHRCAIDLPDTRISNDDCRLVERKACEAEIPSGDVFLHTIPQHYCIDGQPGILNPVGMCGHRLEADFHIVHGRRKLIHDSIRCVRDVGIEVEEVVFSPIATAKTVLSQTQMTEGALVIDIGAGTTDYILYANGVILQTGAFTVGGNMINHDICYHFRIPFALAEKLKTEQGSTLFEDHLSPCRGPRTASLPDACPGFSGKEIEREKLNQIIHLRLSETFKLIKRRIEKEPVAAAASLFLTGGSSLLPGIGPLAQEIFKMPVHLTHAQTAVEEVFKNPHLAAALGLICRE